MDHGTSPGTDEHEGRLPYADAAAVDELVAAATAADGVSPINEETRLTLTDASTRHLLARDPEVGLVGYAAITGDDTGRTAELVVHPGHRRRGVGTVVAGALAATAADAAAWAHGDLPGSSALARRTGYRATRRLYRMSRDRVGAPEPPEPQWPADVVVRTFLVGRDEEAWLRLNARAFAGHPEQGRWTATDLAERLAEPWFDADGLFLVEPASGGEPIGFHWTKLEREHGRTVGEVYVVGVDPDAQGGGLGKALLLVGLRHLYAAGADVVDLYVDGDNTAARRLYERFGFSDAAVDVQYRVRS